MSILWTSFSIGGKIMELIKNTIIMNFENDKIDNKFEILFNENILAPFCPVVKGFRKFFPIYA